MFTGEATGISPNDGPNGTNTEDKGKDYRAGILYIKFGPIKIGYDSEQIRDKTQNWYHDILGIPRFKKTDKKPHWIWQIG